MRALFLGIPSEPTLVGLVITPNRPAAKSFDVAPVTLEALARQALSAVDVASAVQSRHLLMRAVREVLSECDALGFARFFAPAVRELLRLDAELGTVAACGGRLARLAEVTGAYKRRLAERGLVDAAQVFSEAARVTQEIHVTVTGYPRLGLGELTFLDALAADGSQLILPFGEDALFTENGEAAHFLEARGWRVVRDTAADVRGPWHLRASAEALVFPSQEAEVRGVLARVKGHLEAGVRPEHISLIVRDEALYGPLILAVAREYELEIAAYYALPLERTRVGSLMSAFVRMLSQGYAYEATTRFLAHPLTDRLSAELWARIREAHPQDLGAWRALEPQLPTLPFAATRGEFRAKFLTLLNAPELRLPRERLALSALQNELDVLEDDLQMSLTDFLGELDDILHTLSVPVKPGRGVSVHTPLAVLGAELEHVFVLGLAEGTFPAPLQDDAALDFFERKTLRAAGVPVESAPYAAWREQLSFYSLVRGAKGHITFSYPEQLEGQPTEASDYFALLGLEPEICDETLRVSLQERQQATLPDEEGRGSHALEVERAREAAGPFGEFDGVTGSVVDVSNHVFSATQLAHLLSCPFRWFAAYVLKAGAVAEFEEDALLTGNLYHGTLERLAERTRGAADVRMAMLDGLETAFADAEAAQGVPAVSAWSHKRAEFIATLRGAILSPEFIAEDAEVVSTEQSFLSEWHGFKVRGRLDRLDRTPDGFVITDYKTSGYISKPDVQLSIYEAAARSLYPGEEVSARYFSLKRAEPLRSSVPEDLEARLSAARDALASGTFPPVMSRDNCQYCDFELLCRKGPRLDAKTPPDPSC